MKRGFQDNDVAVAASVYPATVAAGEAVTSSAVTVAGSEATKPARRPRRAAAPPPIAPRPLLSVMSAAAPITPAADEAITDDMVMPAPVLMADATPVAQGNSSTATPSSSPAAEAVTDTTLSASSTVTEPIASADTDEPTQSEQSDALNTTSVVARLAALEAEEQRSRDMAAAFAAQQAMEQAVREAARSRLLRQREIGATLAELATEMQSAEARLRTALADLSQAREEAAHDKAQFTLTQRLAELGAQAAQAATHCDDLSAHCPPLDVEHDVLLMRLARAELAAATPPERTSGQDSAGAGTHPTPNPITAAPVMPPYHTATTPLPVTATPVALSTAAAQSWDTPLRSPGDDTSATLPPTPAAATYPTSMPAQLHCPRCNQPVVGNLVSYCPRCGAAQPWVRCSCGEVVQGGTYCSRCGQTLISAIAPSSAVRRALPLGKALGRRLVVGVVVLLIATLAALAVFAIWIALPQVMPSSSSAGPLPNTLSAAVPTNAVATMLPATAMPTAADDNLSVAAMLAVATATLTRLTTPTVTPALVAEIIPVVPVVISDSLTVSDSVSISPTATAAPVQPTSAPGTDAQPNPSPTPSVVAAMLSYPRLGITSQLAQVGLVPVYDRYGRQVIDDGKQAVRWNTERTHASLEQGSPAAGVSGTIVINGHNWGWGRGIFNPLEPVQLSQGGAVQAQMGDTILLTNQGDGGKTYQYVVDWVQLMPPTSTTYLQMVNPTSSGAAQLILITCTAVDGELRVVVHARLKEESYG